MVRENPQSRFFLRRQTSAYYREYYHESGTQNVGTPEESDYVNWTRYLDEARGFRTKKRALSMADLLLSKYGQMVSVIDRCGAAFQSAGLERRQSGLRPDQLCRGQSCLGGEDCR